MTTHGSGAAHNPAISNTGNWIIYEHEGTLYIMDATYTASCPSTSLNTTGELPAWSPDGIQIAFSQNNDIYTATVDYTSNPPLLINPAPLTDANSAFIDTHPSWSADGQSLLLESDRDGTTSLYRVQSPAVLVLQEGRQPNRIKQIPRNKIISSCANIDEPHFVIDRAACT
jgi:Tol biopolymer transport system component